MSKIFRSINKLRNRTLSSSSLAKYPIFLTRTLTPESEQSIFSNYSSFSRTKIHNSNFNSTHGGARSLCSLRTELEVKHQSSSSVGNHNLKRKDLCTSIPVRAYFLSDRIDLIGLMSENQANLIPHTPGMTNHVVLRFADTIPLRNLEAKLSGTGYSYMVVFPYGSAVMFNMLDHEVGRYLKIIKRHASGLQHEMEKDGGDSLRHYIDYEVRENQDIPTWMQGGLNCMHLQQLNIDGICTVGSVLGQSVALDYYSSLVDQWVKEYSGVNYGLEKRGSLRSWIELLKHTRRRSPDAEGVNRFVLSERSDTAWIEDTEYAQMFDYLLDEFQLTERFADLDRKFKMGEFLEHYGEVSMLDIKAADARKVVLVIRIMTLHSFGEGSGVGVSFAGSKGFLKVYWLL